MDHPRVSEELEIGHSDTENRDRRDKGPFETPEDDVLGDMYFSGGDNIYRDFDVPNPDMRQAKSLLAHWICLALDEQKLSTREAEAKIGIAHSEFSRIRNTKLARFTLDRLFLIFHKLEPGKELVLQQKEPAPGRWKRWDEREG